jgi:Raf kinase inhibitor-like YbhB/YbcL family protein
MNFLLTSSAFDHEGTIPTVYTCDGEDISPPLSWSSTPEGTRSLALLVDDPDAPDPEAPKMVWVHWLLYNLPPDLTELAEAIDANALPPGTREGLNDWKRPGYGGPCPPIGQHRYFFKLFALDAELPDLDEPTKQDLEESMHGHVLADAVLMGTYSREQ